MGSSRFTGWAHSSSSCSKSESRKENATVTGWGVDQINNHGDRKVPQGWGCGTPANGRICMAYKWGWSGDPTYQVGWYPRYTSTHQPLKQRLWLSKRHRCQTHTHPTHHRVGKVVVHRSESPRFGRSPVDILLMGSEIQAFTRNPGLHQKSRPSPVEVGSWNPIIYHRFFLAPSERWLFVERDFLNHQQVWVPLV